MTEEIKAMAEVASEEESIEVPLTCFQADRSDRSFGARALVAFSPECLDN